jgi:tRNA-5-taurinomethyluridine 2-sulfurtransferase
MALRVAALTSGGVDSSLALSLLKEQGHDVTAFYLKVWLEDELDYLGDCPWEEDLEYVQQLCERLDVPLEIVPLQQDYRERVISYALAEVRAGRTPNPDIMCNSRIKFGAFYDRIDSTYDLVATGHYANARRESDRTLLTTAPDPIKDQTYFLAHLNQAQVRRATFPIGAYRKSEVRAMAEARNLPAKNRKDSQGLCFLGKISFRDFIKHYLGETPGEIVEAETGKVLGEHRGYWFYTIGQRQGLGLSGGPWYVLRKDLGENRIFVSRNYYDAEKPRDSFEAGALHWVDAPPEKTELHVKLRHGETSYGCNVELLGPDLARVKLNGRDQGIAPGQFAVFYDGEVCLGCGVILHETSER